jgi:prepilin-type N-terminal cleavage/methylation domain-containing protein
MKLSRSQLRGLTLVEIMIVIALLGVIALVGVPIVNNVFAVQQRAAIQNIAQTYVWLGEEAQLRNVCFRLAINLDQNSWKIEIGDANALVFSNPDEAKEYSEAIESKMRRFTKRQREEEGLDEKKTPSQFDKMDESAFTTEHVLPDGLYFSFVYTPQYGEDGIRPNDEFPDDPEDERIAYSHIFPDGSAEHTVIQIMEYDDEQPLSLIIEPLSGKVQVTTELREPTESLSWVPEEGPTFR